MEGEAHHKILRISAVENNKDGSENKVKRNIFKKTPERESNLSIDTLSVLNRI
jgi:hypothetical protein